MKNLDTTLIKDKLGPVYTENEMYDLHEEFLDDVHGLVTIGGYEYQTSKALRSIDPVAFNQSYLDYADSVATEQELVEIDNDWYSQEEINQLMFDNNL